ncbi:unnamed protein product [Kuraishia capsulata CBS 1993]|uniref:HTH cro/C1-type domain-containing protein n=1 Tax=Kuraishia capsulata CBS 1993 TaxID=1382522 RepID=W6MT05_9ASCO|nr:uncharacterized protein KUCA_T00000877001 [Kuraishia capsulata CBS 1993]CDK24910.1 unnamed protein product [Kuraishia capsulata CBS 1993]
MSDWDTVTVIGSKARVGGSAPRDKVVRTAAQLNSARRQGNVVAVEKKWGTTNAKGGAEGQRLAKLDRSDEIEAPKKVDQSVGKTISKVRLEKQMTQKDLAVKINEKPNIVNDYEAGRAIPNQQILAKMERALGVKLRGKAIGEPLFAKKK